jgi:hypothetical protein
MRVEKYGETMRSGDELRQVERETYLRMRMEKKRERE